MSLLARLHQLDPSGEAFRYANHLKTTAYHVDVVRLTAIFRDAFGIVHGGVLTQLNSYEDFQRDMYHYHTDY